MDRPKVTVLMSFRNSARYILKAAESILNQDYEDFEFLIINDGSTDASAEIIASLKDKRIRLIVNRENIGLTKSLILGLGVARSEYIARMDADDISYPFRLSSQLAVLGKNPDISVVGCHYEVIDEEARPLRKRGAVNDNRIIKQLLAKGENPLVHGSVVFRKKDAQAIGGYNEKFYYAQDFELWSRMIKRFIFCVVEKPLYQLRSFSILDKDKYIFQRFYREYISKNCSGTDFVKLPDDLSIRGELDRLYLAIPKYYTSNYYLWVAKGNILKNPLYSLKSIYKSFYHAPRLEGKRFLFGKLLGLFSKNIRADEKTLL